MSTAEIWLLAALCVGAFALLGVTVWLIASAPVDIVLGLRPPARHVDAQRGETEKAGYP